MHHKTFDPESMILSVILFFLRLILCEKSIVTPSIFISFLTVSIADHVRIRCKMRKKRNETRGVRGQVQVSAPSVTSPIYYPHHHSTCHWYDELLCDQKAFVLTPPSSGSYPLPSHSSPMYLHLLWYVCTRP